MLLYSFAMSIMNPSILCFLCPVYMSRGGTAPGQSTPLEDVASALMEQFQKSVWNVSPGTPDEWPFMLSVMRATIIAWFTPAETLEHRLLLGEALAEAFGMSEDAKEQASPLCILVSLN